jgi:hypothetical protein
LQQSSAAAQNPEKQYQKNYIRHQWQNQINEEPGAIVMSHRRRHKLKWRKTRYELSGVSKNDGSAYRNTGEISGENSQ